MVSFANSAAMSQSSRSGTPPLALGLKRAEAPWEHIGALQHWPRWRIEGANRGTLGDLIRRLRNGTAHGNIAFSSDGRRIEDVLVTVMDRQWTGTISAADLRAFCLKFIDLVHDLVG